MPSPYPCVYAYLHIRVSASTPIFRASTPVSSPYPCIGIYLSRSIACIDICSLGPTPRGASAQATANYLKTEVADGIIAPGFTPGALAILAAKKQGGFIVLQASDYI